MASAPAACPETPCRYCALGLGHEALASSDVVNALRRHEGQYVALSLEAAENIAMKRQMARSLHKETFGTELPRRWLSIEDDNEATAQQGAASWGQSWWSSSRGDAWQAQPSSEEAPKEPRWWYLAGNQEAKKKNWRLFCDEHQLELDNALARGDASIQLGTDPEWSITVNLKEPYSQMNNQTGMVRKVRHA